MRVATSEYGFLRLVFKTSYSPQQLTLRGRSFSRFRMDGVSPE